MFDLFFFSVCYLLPDIVITIFYNTTVNVQPLSPHLFEKFAPNKKLSLVLSVCVLLIIFVYIVADVRVPLPPPLGQNAPCLILLGTIVG